VLAGAASVGLDPTRADAVAGSLRSIARGVHERQRLREDDAIRTIVAAAHDVLMRLLR
jgi:hypothetical protein